MSWNSIRTDSRAILLLRDMALESEYYRGDVDQEGKVSVAIFMLINTMTGEWRGRAKALVSALDRASGPPTLRGAGERALSLRLSSNFP